ncbi:MAG: hypothetical protein M3P48_05335, partial [Actinomycetota bacterium]|nr:hypothetical protein [Actinomycetota bacterium]
RLDRVYAAGSPRLRDERRVLSGLRRRGLSVRGYRLALLSVRVSREAPRRVELRVADQLSPYRFVDARGRTVGTVPGRGARSWRMVLVPAERGHWRIRAVRPVG